MKHKRIAALALPAAALFAFAAPVPEAAAQDQFTFTANLDASQLHEDVAQVGFTCRVCPIADCGGFSPGNPPNPNFAIGRNFLKFPIAGETSFNQTVTLGVNVDPGENPEAVQGWWCSLQTHNSPGFEGPSGAGACIGNEPQPDFPPFMAHAVGGRTVVVGSFSE